MNNKIKFFQNKCITTLINFQIIMKMIIFILIILIENLMYSNLVKVMPFFLYRILFLIMSLCKIRLIKVFKKY